MLEQLIQLVRDVGEDVVMPLFLSVARQQKEDGSILTEADLAAQEALQAGLKAICNCPVVGEEMTAEEQQKNWAIGNAHADAPGVWCVDPIDGTSNFASGLPQFAISAAYIKQGRPLLGVVYAPALQELFYAKAGKGAYMRTERMATTSLPLVTPDLNPAASLREAVAAVDFKRLPKKLAADLAVQPPYHSQRNFGASTLDWCYLACGRYDLYLHGGQKLWDYAAASLVLQEAGGRMRTFEARDGEDFWDGDLWLKSVVAGRDPGMFEVWSRWLAQYR